MKRVYRLDIEFQSAFWKIPYTTKSRGTYLIPRKKALISIFNPWMKLRRKQIEDNIDSFLVGAALVDFNKTIENQTIAQYGKNVTFPSNTEILINPQYIFYLVTDIKLSEPVTMPFGGQNDHLVKWFNLREMNLKPMKSKKFMSKFYTLVEKEKIDSIKGGELVVESIYDKYVIAKGNISFKEKSLKIKEGCCEIPLV